MATLWDQFDFLLKEAESAFANMQFDEALAKWEEYYKITARTEYSQIYDEIKRLLQELNPRDIEYADVLLAQFRKIRRRFFERQIHKYTYDLFLELLKKIYSDRFRRQEDAPLLLHGVFHCLLRDYPAAEVFLKKHLEKDFSSVEARVFLGHVYMQTERQREAIALLTQNLFLAADQLYEDDMYLSQFKLLFGRLFTQTGRRDAALWRLVFEAWYRNFLVIEENPRFFKLMVQKEQNERIIRVKYTAAERYRHFARCLFVAEYARFVLKNKPGLIEDQEAYMEKLDAALFARYRRKRKPPKK